MVTPRVHCGPPRFSQFILVPSLEGGEEVIFPWYEKGNGGIFLIKGSPEKEILLSPYEEFLSRSK